MNKTVEIILLGLLLSAPFMHDMERREVPVERTPAGTSLLGMPDELRKLILSHLCASQDPVEAIKSLLSLRMACREWNKYLNDDQRLQVFVYDCFGKQNLEKLFFDAARESNIEGVKVLLNAGIDINAQNKHGVTALHRAAFGEKINVVQLLLEGGVDVNLQDNHGRTALHWAAYKGNVNVYQLLLAQESIDPSIQNNDGNTALMTARCYCHADIKGLLTAAPGGGSAALKEH